MIGALRLVTQQTFRQGTKTKGQVYIYSEELTKGFGSGAQVGVAVR